MDEQALRVILPPEYDEQLKKQVMATIEVAIKEARRQTAIDSPWLSSKQAIAKWLKVSPGTLTILINNGLPIHFLPEVDKVVGYKREITEWMLQL
ncbi:hypothetical protein [Levilactobacillus andaensis]|uniref:hypothetical protein n=1 Tax=Levilactobacillus andaensis TaxID=2799570 RepID=UPI001943D517|nr:hypothetical protein [Levilactobacillus andaensis]